PDTLFARNVSRLAEGVRAKVAELETPVNGVRRMLERHADTLGLTHRPDAPRVVATRDAADLLARLSGAAEDTDLVNRLAKATYGTNDTVLAATMAAAPRLLESLRDVEWSLVSRSEEHTSELQSRENLVCR